MKFAPDARLVRKPEVEVRPIENGAVLVNMVSGGCFELNRTGVEVWDLIAEGQTFESIVTTLVMRYGITREVASADVARVVEDLSRQALITISPAAERPR